MEEPSATTEVSTSRDLSAEIKSFGNDCSYDSSKDAIGVSIPVCYLIKEQAKAHIAIQELQNRLSQVETVQEDVVDAIIEFRNYLSDSKSFSNANSLSTPRSTSVILSKLNSVSKSKENYVPSATDSSVEIPQSILKTRSYSSKDCDPKSSDGKSQAIAGVPELSLRQLDLIKSKDSALESDKQDSGLDSDCREHHEIHPSIGKCVPNPANEESNDELLQLLDEISHRSTVLQKQLAIAEEVTTLTDLKEMTSRSRNGKSDLKGNNCTEAYSFLEASRNGLTQDHHQQSNLAPPVGKNCKIYAEERVPIALKPNGSIAGLFEGKPLCDRRPSRKKVVNSIDSTVVSSILKETNVVDLQRQALIYLVDNAVLNTKLREAEQSLSSKHIESEKVENALKEEARLLMMENRELRISLDEQRMENTSLKSRLVMLEKVVQSVSNENQELSWQLSESLNLQNFPKRGSLNYSSSFRSDNPVSAIRSGRRSSHPVNPAPFHNERNMNCVRSKLLSNNSSFLDVNVEDSRTDSTAFGSSAAYRFKNKPIYSSTPMMPSQKQKGIETGLSKSPNLSDMSPTNFHSVKKCLKTSYTSDQGNASSQTSKSGCCLEETCSSNIPETHGKKYHQNVPDDVLSQEGAGKFPFNTILEKLKSNSEYRLTKSASAKAGELSSDHSEPSRVKSPVNSCQVGPLQDGGNISHFKEAKSSQETNAEVILQRKKGRNIQQRIQNILDRIVAESEEAS